ncbi:MAG: hypothetical protein IPH52_07515 [Leptospiraceae bacterium]|nr:hypothetical protein [Leptospiraceae bacterium]
MRWSRILGAKGGLNTDVLEAVTPVISNLAYATGFFREILPSVRNLLGKETKMERKIIYHEEHEVHEEGKNDSH